MKRWLACAWLVLVSHLGLPLVARDTRPLRVSIACNPSQPSQPGGRVQLFALAKDADGADLAGPVTYRWNGPNTLDLSALNLNQMFLTLTDSVTLGCNSEQVYPFTVAVQAGERVGSASYTLRFAPRPSRDASPNWLKVSIACAPANRTLKPGQPLVLTAVLEPAGGGVNPALVTYGWSVSPDVNARLPNSPVLNLGPAQTQGLKSGQAYVFSLTVKIGKGEVSATCTVNVAPPSPLLLERPKAPVPLQRPGVKP
jgi:hypothetical protein